MNGSGIFLDFSHGTGELSNIVWFRKTKNNMISTDSNVTVELTTPSASDKISLIGEVNSTDNYDNRNITFFMLTSTIVTNTSSTEVESFYNQDLSSGYKWLSLLLLVFVICGGLGNVLVCLAICRERQLQNITNYFLLSLAVADLLVCIVVMPFGIVDEFFGYWPFGSLACNVWVTCDVLGCTSSIIHMCFISLGRYLGIRNPLKARRSSKKMVTMKIAVVWLVAMTITSPITVLGNIDAKNIQPTSHMCAINNRFFFFFGSLSAFYIPMFVMVTSYILTVRLLRQKAKFCAEKTSRRVPFTRRSRKQSLQQNSNNSLGVNMEEKIHKCDKCDANQHHTKSSETSFFDDPCTNTQINNFDCDRSLRKEPHIKFKVIGGMICALGTSSHVMNEQKATKVLGIVFFCFTICWTPFFMINILFPIVGPSTFPDYLITTFLWLGYVSSTINPIIYTIFNKTFRRAFSRLLSCSCCSSRIKSPTINEMASLPEKSKPFVVKCH
ncbi:5-hydroxytryptamine receptor 2C-like [Limulus polyphemus]|uniref:5-hydroxytryptamine receptor 2C-like n=1 Tax=Limulus polyphemus TaxID=6850 RepID=A0ABM1B7M4_LIMPO|nr:5-hydroxytryptamine receptor 2C-like [Limulus polyphemus]